MIYSSITDLCYLISTVFFIIGLKRLSSPKTATKGNALAATGMILGILTALFGALGGEPVNNYGVIAVALALGITIGLIAAKKVEMTAMPELVSLFNGFGGAGTLALAVVELVGYLSGVEVPFGVLLTVLSALFIGAVSFTGSLVAFGKLKGIWNEKLKLPYSAYINVLLLLIVVIAMVFYSINPSAISLGFVLGLIFLSLFYGFSFVSPIGGGDMPVVIAFLNSLTGIGAALAGIVYTNNVMLFGGILVGASGIILTVLMCNAMNRSLAQVLVGNFGGTSSSSSDDGDRVVKEVSMSDLAVQLKYAKKVLVVPGYGLAVAQAQHVCRELEVLLEDEGVEVKYAIHPVAGRMPGHMNVLLAESDVPYEKLLDLDDANKSLEGADVVLVIGANDVVNPAAKTDSGSPIYGMPILEVENAHQVVVFKRSMNPGYAGVQNELFFKDKTKMLFGDAKQSLSGLVKELAEV
ncbi:NAD(P)(+) transhydrogenase (Re/Si-specific) subunit beta [Mangrovivirga halotolerans]|uniref:NAD(P)(+) transhydrogenase (Re/Si-specific) subunit beta n=1 Tax=Mangrovivirga halotolerans TaxID=2993936 RepID=UPI00272DDA9E|nr:NAD(P)(+) transhydrogenase (Re/Si-specific) subunit beta [Mangrovivirga halotolerans]